MTENKPARGFRQGAASLPGATHRSVQIRIVIQFFAHDVHVAHRTSASGIHLDEIHRDQFGSECVIVLLMAFYDLFSNGGWWILKGLKGLQRLARAYEFAASPQRTHEGRLRGRAVLEEAKYHARPDVLADGHCG